MSTASPSVRVHINIDISAASLQSIVAHAKRNSGPDGRGRYPVDTADVLSAMISKFLDKKGFEAFARDPANYG